MNKELFDKLNKPLPSQANQAMYGGAMGMLSAQAGPVAGAVSESSDEDEKSKNPDGLKADLIGDNDYKNAVRNLANCNKDIEDLEGSISEDMDADKRKEVLAKLAEKKEYLKTLRAKLKLAEVKARAKIDKEKSKEVKESAEYVQEASLKTIYNAKKAETMDKIAEHDLRKNSAEYKKLHDQCLKTNTDIIIMNEDITKAMMRNNFNKAAELKVKLSSLVTLENNLQTQLGRLAKAVEPTLPASYWKARIAELKKCEASEQTQIAKLTAAANSINAQNNPEVKKEFQSYITNATSMLGTTRHSIAEMEKKISSSPVKESVNDEYMQEANIFQKAAIRADSMVNKIGTREYRKDANFKALDDATESLNIKMKELNLDIERLEAKGKTDQAEELKVQLERLFNQSVKVANQYNEQLVKVEDGFSKSVWRKKMAKFSKDLEKRKVSLEKSLKRRAYFQSQSDDDMVKKYDEIIKEREKSIEIGTQFYNKMLAKYNAAKE